ncbi:site-specific integrase [Microvirga sp. 3-52]|nr:site-specific integrase [Microvirga sp. 3-52]
MATIRKRGSSWQVQVRRDGFPPLTKTFSIRADAAEWARDKERQIDRAELLNTIRDFKGITVADLLRRYEQEVTPRKRGARFEQSRLRQLLAHGIAKTSLHNLSGASVSHYRDDRLKVVKPASVRRELVVLRHVFEVARTEWAMPIRTNPVYQIKLPNDSKPRERRLEEGDSARLADAIRWSNSAWYLRPLIALATETGMRRGELLSICWKDVDQTACTIRILKTKNGNSRTIPLTPKAVEVLASLERKDERVFPVTPNAVRLAWERLRRRAGLEDLRLHDLRHEAVSRFFEYGLTVPEVALISGHRDPRMLSRYTHLRPEKVAEKLARLTN